MAGRQLKHFWDSLTGKSVSYVILALIVTIFIVTAVSILQGRDLLQSQVRQQLALTADLVAGSLDDKLQVRFNAVNDVARSLRMPESELFGADGSASQRILALSGLFDRVLLLDAEGRLHTEWPAMGQTGTDLSGRDYFQQTSQRLTTLISEPFISDVTGEPTVNFSAPVLNDNQRMIGVLVGCLQLDAGTLIGGLRDLYIGESGYIGIATREGITLAHPDPDQIMQPVPMDNPAVQMALEGFEGTTMAMNVQDEEALYRFRQLNEVPWIVGVILPTREAYAPFSQFVRTAIWASLGLLLILALLSWRIFRRLLAPLGELETQIVARHIGERLSPVSARGSVEIRHVAETFNTIFDQRAQSLQQTQEREAFFRTLSENLPLGILQTDILGRVTFLNPAFSAITGIGLSEGLNRNWLDGLHAEDRESVREDWLNALVENRVFQSRFRINNANGGIRWVEVVATKIDSAGSVIGYIASVRDVTLEHRVQELLEAERRRSNSILDTIAEGVILTELDGRIRYLNGPARRYIACERELLDQCLFDLVQVEVGGEKQTSEALLQLARLENLDVTLGNRRGESWELELTMLRTERAEADDQLIFVLRDDSKRRRQEERLTWEATHDALTGLVNRRAFSSRLNEQIRQVNQGGGAAALILVDLDEFKPINDQGGHLAGDQLLRELAQAMRQQVRQSDTVARLGGDEFALILPGCTLDRATELAEAVRSAIADLRISYEGKPYGVTASLGVAIVRHGEDSSRSLIGRADKACYAAKAKGRNAVEVGC
jgi:diguanylate cyclase (GGDEF)-like protein/PAS domain S-box-containing protein